MARYSFDPKCFELAKHFNPDWPDNVLAELAQSLQNVVEDFDADAWGIQPTPETEVAGCTAITTNSKYQRLQRCPHGVHQDNRCRVCD